uniref:Integrase n=1 Tax=Heterorhabditis bacteriophora TaxID=37862 RepID=A0A1I7WAH5_HETBA
MRAARRIRITTSFVPLSKQWHQYLV